MRPILPLRFESIQTLRETATSSTFVATDHLLGRNNVVVKAIRKGDLTDNRSDLVDIFSWYRGLRHAHIAGMLDAGLTPKGDLFYVRDFAPSTQLFNTRDMVLLNVLLGAVDFVHSMGRVHGSIKPSNVLASSNAVQLADPWIPQQRKEASSEEEVRFSAPEVLKGHPRTIESDLYSVGALLYRFFSGRDLFDDADLESLRERYIWASPRPLTSISYVSRTIADIVENLVHKDPSQRRPAFDALKNELHVHSAAAARSPVFGMGEPLEKGERFLQENVDRLRILVVEAPAGFGKTRYIEELRNRMALRTPNLAFSACPAVGPSADITVAQWLLSLFERHCSSFEDPSVRRLQALIDETRDPLQGRGSEHFLHDLINVIASITQKRPLTLVVDDIDRTRKKVRRLIDSLVSRATRLRLCIVVTTRPGGIHPRTLKTFKDYAGSALEQISLGHLRDTDCESIAAFLERDEDRRLVVSQRAGGNPLFLEEYSRNHGPSVPRVVRNAILQLVSSLTVQSKRIAEVLSLFEKCVELDVLREIVAIPSGEFEKHWSYLRSLGVCDDRIVILHEDTRRLLQSRIPNDRRLRLHALCFERLRESVIDKDSLARHAYLGGLFKEASNIYLGLAHQAMRSRRFKSAVHHFEVVRKCREKDSAIPSADAEERICLARCQAYLGDPAAAQDAMRRLVTLAEVQTDPELLSSAYAASASTFMQIFNTERIRLLNLAIACLPTDSPTLVHRYASLINAFLLAGRVDEAEMSLHKIIDRGMDDSDREEIEALRVTVLACRGRFREVASLLANKNIKSVTSLAIANNHAVYLENLGDIREARRVQSAALREARASALEVICLGNLGSMETKLGNMRQAEVLFETAIAKFEKTRRSEMAPLPIATCYSDAASHWIARGEYHNAIRCISKIKNRVGSGFQSDGFQVLVPQCELQIALGSFDEAAAIFESTRKFGSHGGYFDIERMLLRTRMEAQSPHLCTDLKTALGVSLRLETRYQQCRILIALGKVLSSTGDVAEARTALDEALDLSLKGGYRLLGAECLMQRGLIAQGDSERWSDFAHCLQETSAMSLQPLLAECSLHVGIWRLSCGDYSAARDHLFRSVSVMSHMAEGLSATDQKRYLLLPMHRKAMDLLEEATSKSREFVSNLREPLGKDDIFFGEVYRLTSSLNITSDYGLIVKTLNHSIRQCIRQTSIIILEDDVSVTLYPATENVAEDMRQRAMSAFRNSSNKIFFVSLGKGTGPGSAVWIPISSHSMRAGIYVECRTPKTTLGEPEIQFLTVSAAIAGAALDRRVAIPSSIGIDQSQDFHGIVGRSQAMQIVLADIGIAARNSATVLIEGESGTGKELVARAIHTQSLRAHSPFVPIDCGALPESLIEAELFGTKRGSYTGAVEDRRGLFESAEGGSIFLDEIANASPAFQTKLLRVLQEREIRRLGDTKGRRVDVRVIAATNCNLEMLVDQGRFRQDLLFRLKVLHIKLPRLKERKEDVPLLAISFLKNLNLLNETNKEFDGKAMSDLLAMEYPGNVRELQNIVERSFYGTDGHMITKVVFRSHAENSARAIDEAENSFRELIEGRGSFWSAVRDRYKRRDISREGVIALVDRGLRSTKGNYKAVASLFNVKDEEYRRFMDFLRRNDCLLDFRRYR